MLINLKVREIEIIFDNLQEKNKLLAIKPKI